MRKKRHKRICVCRLQRPQLLPNISIIVEYTVVQIGLSSFNVSWGQVKGHGSTGLSLVYQLRCSDLSFWVVTPAVGLFAQLTTGHRVALSTIGYVGCSISIFCLAITLVTFAVLSWVSAAPRLTSLYSMWRRRRVISNQGWSMIDWFVNRRLMTPLVDYRFVGPTVFSLRILP